VSNLDDSIGKILLDLQKDDPDTFKKLMKKAQAENPELFKTQLMLKIQKLMNIIKK